jgi:hypothetical protein
MKTYDITNIDFTKGQQVVSAAQKFIIPVGNYGDEGEPLVFPEGHEKAGQAITDYKGRPVGDRGIVFFNATDNVVQCAPGDGSAVIIVNNVTAEQAKEIAAKVMEFNTDPSKLALNELKAVLNWLYSQGHKDFYNSNVGFVAKSLSRLGAAFQNNDGEIPNFGLYKRDDKDICQALLVQGPAEVHASAAEPTRFPNDGIVLKHGESLRAIQTNAFIATYTNVDGTAIRVSDLPVA